MQESKTDRELTDYLDSVYVKSHSDRTYASYRMAITNKHKNGFRDFLYERHNCDEIQFVFRVKNEEFDLFKILREYVVYLDKQEYMPKSIEQRVTAIKGYLRHLGLKFYSEDFKHGVTLPKVRITREEPLTKNMIQRVMANISAKLQVVILMLSSSGMRIGELAELRISDIDFSEKPTRIMIRAETTKTSEARETFITEEATRALKDYLYRYFHWQEGERNLHMQSLQIFGRTSASKSGKESENPTAYSISNLLMKSLVNSIRNIPDLDSKNSSNGRRVIHYHALRKYFRTIVGNVAGRDYAEALMGRRFYLDTYYNMPAEDRRKKYLDVEPYLIISDTKTVEKNYNKLSEKHEQLEEKMDGLIKYLRTNSIQVPHNLK